MPTITIDDELAGAIERFGVVKQHFDETWARLRTWDEPETVDALSDARDAAFIVAELVLERAKGGA